MKTTGEEKMYVLDIKHTSAKSVGYTIQKGIYEVTDDNLMLKSLLPDDLKVNLTIDDFRQRSNLTTHVSMKLTKKLFFCTILGFTHYQSGPLGDSEGFVHKIPGTN